MIYAYLYKKTRPIQRVKKYNIYMFEENISKFPISKQEFSRLKVFHNVCYESVIGYLLHSSIDEVEQGFVLIDPSKTDKKLVVLLEGKLEVHIDSIDGVLADYIEEGCCAGEMSIFDNCNPSAWVISSTKCKVLIISAPTTLAMLNASHDLCLNFLHLLSQRVRYSNKVVCEDQYHIRCIEQYSQIDTLTSLHNRRWLEEMYTRELKRSHAGDFRLCAFMIDIDFFKRINDTYGHLAGDVVLVEIARTLNESLRPSDMPVRFGGEEFSVFLPGTTSENAKVIAERIRANIEKKEIKLPSGAIVHVTVSIGFAEREKSDSVESLIGKADKALYQAKQHNRNRICMYVSKDETFLF